MKEEIADHLKVKRLGGELIDLFEVIKRKYRLPKRLINRAQDRVKAAVDEVTIGAPVSERRELQQQDVMKLVDDVRNLQIGTPVLVFQLKEDRSGIVEQCSGKEYKFKDEKDS